jgi:hypothetical protein
MVIPVVTRASSGRVVAVGIYLAVSKGGGS